MMIFLGHSRAKMGEKSTKIGHSGHFRGVKRAKNGQKWVNFEVGSLAERSNPGPKNPAHKNLNPAKNELIPAQLGKFFGVQSGPILALWWPERATAEVENAKIFGLRGALPP